MEIKINLNFQSRTFSEYLIYINLNRMSTEKYQFFFTGSDNQMLLDGIEVDIDVSMNQIQCEDYLKQFLQNKVDFTEKRLIIYLAGGIPFISGTLSELYLNKDIQVKKVLYGVLTRNIPEKELNNLYYELCNVSNPNRKLLISPICDSTDRGLSDMACLLGYLSHNSSYSDIFHKSTSTVIHFPPFITSLSRMINNDEINGRDIITVCSTLFTFFKSSLPFKCPDEKVYEYSLQLCTLISKIENLPGNLPILHLNPDESTQLFFNISHRSFLYLWKGDMNEDFAFENFEIKDKKCIKNACFIDSPFNPISPFSLPNQYECAIVKGKNYEYLYLMKYSSKAYEKKNLYDILDPLKGMAEPVDIESFAKLNSKNDEISDIIDAEKVKQIIMFDIDISKSMIGDLNGFVIGNDSEKVHRIAYARQCISIISDKLYGYHIPCIKGLATFNNLCRMRCHLTPFNDEFENCLTNFNPDSTTKLYDSIIMCCDEINKYRKDILGNEIYKNAVFRICLISDGEDVNSKNHLEDVIKILIKNKIRVDAIIFNLESKLSSVITICHITGGVAIQFDEKKTFSILENSAFINYEERLISNEPLIPGDRSTIPSRIKPEQITAEFLEKLSQNANYDTDVLNKEITQATLKVPLITPRCVCGKYSTKIIQESRIRRILRELDYAAQISDPESLIYDSEIKIFPYKSSIEKWKVFIKGLENTPCSNKWFYLHVTLPELYPLIPPVIRFITVPNHPNIMSDGRICIDIIEKGYLSSTHVVDILQQIREVFLCYDMLNPSRLDSIKAFESYKDILCDSAKLDYNDYLNCNPIDDIPKDFKIAAADDDVPVYMKSQITGKKLNNQKKYLSSSGIFYDKNELLQYIESRKKPLCVVTNKMLVDSESDFI